MLLGLAFLFTLPISILAPPSSLADFNPGPTSGRAAFSVHVTLAIEVEGFGACTRPRAKMWERQVRGQLSSAVFRESLQTSRVKSGSVVFRIVLQFLDRPVPSARLLTPRVLRFHFGHHALRKSWSRFKPGCCLRTSPDSSAAMAPKAVPGQLQLTGLEDFVSGL